MDIEYQRGTNAPLAMKMLLNLLNMLDDAEIVRVVSEWKNETEKGHSLTEEQTEEYPLISVIAIRSMGVMSYKSVEGIMGNSKQPDFFIDDMKDRPQ